MSSVRASGRNCHATDRFRPLAVARDPTGLELTPTSGCGSVHTRPWGRSRRRASPGDQPEGPESAVEGGLARGRDSVRVVATTSDKSCHMPFDPFSIARQRATAAVKFGEQETGRIPEARCSPESSLGSPSREPRVARQSSQMPRVLSTAPRPIVIPPMTRAFCPTHTLSSRHGVPDRGFRHLSCQSKHLCEYCSLVQF